VAEAHQVPGVEASCGVDRDVDDVMHLCGRRDAARVFTVMAARMPVQMDSAQPAPVFAITTLLPAATGAIGLSAAMRAVTCHELVAGRAPTWRYQRHAA
jgi:hypothetical protein